MTAVATSATGALQRQARLFAGLVLRPRESAAEVLREGSLGLGLLAITLACAVAVLNTTRFAELISVSDLAYGPERSPLVSTLLEAIGTQRTAVVVYLVEQVWAAVLIVTAIGPLLVWLLGASAVHAAARIASAGRPFWRFAVFGAYATATALLPTGVASFLLEGDPRSLLAIVGRLIGFALLVWLGWLYFYGIRAYYGVPPRRALTILVLAVTLFYLAPLLLIAVAVVAIVVAAVVLELA
jgi:hypothetical protein